MKIVKRYQQTFQVTGTNPQNNTGIPVQFNRIYKQNPGNKFVMRVTSLAFYQAYAASNVPVSIFAVGLDLNGSCTFNTTGDTITGGDLYQSNDFCLGVLNDASGFGVGGQWDNNIVMLNEVPLIPFFLRWQSINQTAYQISSAISISAVFEIIEYEGDLDKF